MPKVSLMPNTDLLSIEQAAELLHISPRAVRHRITAGTLVPAHKMPGRTGAYLIARSEIERVLAGEAA